MTQTDKLGSLSGSPTNLPTARSKSSFKVRTVALSVDPLGLFKLCVSHPMVAGVIAYG